MKKLQTKHAKSQGLIMIHPVGEQHFDEHGIITVSEEHAEILKKHYPHFHFKEVGENGEAQKDEATHLSDDDKQGSTASDLGKEIDKYFVDQLEDEDIKFSLQEKMKDKKVITASELSVKEQEYVTNFLKQNPQAQLKQPELTEEQKQKQENIDKIMAVPSIKQLRELAKEFPAEEWVNFKSKDEFKTYLCSKLD